MHTVSSKILQNSSEYLYLHHQLNIEQTGLQPDEQLSRQIKRDTIRSLEYVKEFILLTDDLKLNGFRFLPLKGPVLSYRIYTDAAYRKCHDIDLLIEFKDLNEYHEFLLQKGYQPENPEISRNFKSSGLYNNRKDAKYFHTEKKTIVELHWRLFTYDIFFRNDELKNLRPFITEIDFMKRILTVFTHEFEILYLIMHGSVHNWGILKWLYDVNDYLKSNDMDFLKIYNYSEKFNLGKALSLYNVLAKRYITNPHLFSCSEKVEKYLIDTCIEKIEKKQHYSHAGTEKIRKSLGKLKYQFLLVPGFKRKFHLILKYVKRDIFGRIVYWLI